MKTESQWLQDWRRDKRENRKRLVAAMRWWRAQHPEYTRVRVISHGWYGHAVFGDFCHEHQCLANVADVLAEYAKATAL